MRWTQEQLDDYQRRFGITMTTGKEIVTATPQPKPPKFGNRKTTDVAGVVHDSKGEQRRWQELQLRERAGEIQRLRRQVPYALVVNGLLVCSYVADFDYDEGQAHIVEDHKSKATRKLRDYRIKLKLMQAIHGIQIREV